MLMARPFIPSSMFFPIDLFLFPEYERISVRIFDMRSVFFYQLVTSSYSSIHTKFPTVRPLQLISSYGSP